MSINDAKRVSQQLKATSKKHENDTVYTFDTNISNMAKDSARTIDWLIDVVETLQGSIQDVAEQAREV